MSERTPSSSAALPAAQAHGLAGLVDYADGAVVSRTLAKNKAGTLTCFAFDAGQEISEHSTPVDAYVQCLDGQLELIIGGDPVAVQVGEIVLMPADVPHAVKAPGRCKMLLTMLRDPARES